MVAGVSLQVQQYVILAGLDPAKKAEILVLGTTILSITHQFLGAFTMMKTMIGFKSWILQRD
jgi:hypothetical protein